jgi:hypothetical protein
MFRPSVCVALLWSSVLSAQTAPAPDVAAWRGDLRLLAIELPRRHPAPFHRITAAQWDSATGSVNRRLPIFTRNQILVELYRLVALIGDAHTAVQPDPALGLRYYPLELYAFEDGLFVRRADSAHAYLVAHAWSGSAGSPRTPRWPRPAPSSPTRTTGGHGPGGPST